MAEQAMKRIPRIKFPQRRPKPSESSPQPKASSTDDALRSFLSRSASQNNTLSTSGRASEQPQRTPVSKEEMEAILLDETKGIPEIQMNDSHYLSCLLFNLFTQWLEDHQLGVSPWGTCLSSLKLLKPEGNKPIPIPSFKENTSFAICNPLLNATVHKLRFMNQGTLEARR
ncbi:hypothetical protein Cgig2_031496 [Carnegiea gigantea]|uniref:Uncharacterized protein n=1 Tax=Carnegiea gigantea TaxID=171969 RepID=A0A9Q1K517_9CARY|nr:hypothetical protein Cgig2_031496 [Carnegiea gigantea]